MPSSPIICPVVSARDDDGAEYMYWFTRDERDDECEFCKLGRCVQKVMQYPGDEIVLVVIHNDPADLN